MAPNHPTNISGATQGCPPPYDQIESHMVNVQFEASEIWTPQEMKEINFPGGSRGQKMPLRLVVALQAARMPQKFMIRMRMDEYRRYFVKNRTGEYAPMVTEPLGGRKRWLQQRFREQQTSKMCHHS